MFSHRKLANTHRTPQESVRESVTVGQNCILDELQQIPEDYEQRDNIIIFVVRCVRKREAFFL